MRPTALLAMGPPPFPGLPSYECLAWTLTRRKGFVFPDLAQLMDFSVSGMCPLISSPMKCFLFLAFQVKLGLLHETFQSHPSKCS